MTENAPSRQQQKPDDLDALLRLDVPFGPAFFLKHLAGFVRDRCPTPAEALPHVRLHLADGEVLELCHVIALAPHWVAFAVVEAGEGAGNRPMHTELVPYQMLVRVVIRASPVRGSHIGFHQASPPVVQATPEKLLHVAASLRTEGGTDRPTTPPGGAVQHKH